MHKQGVRGIAQDLIRFYFDIRYHFISINNKHSAQENSNIETIQGSNLGSLLFILYVNDINNLFNEDVKISMYADDTVITIHNDSFEMLHLKAINILNKLVDWCNFNKLDINTYKTKYIIFSTANHPPMKLLLKDYY